MLRIKPDGTTEIIPDITITASDIENALGFVPAESDGAGAMPTGGTAGQRLTKIDAADYNAHWVTPFDGTWTSLTGKPSFAPVATSGSYVDLTERPVLFDGTWTSLTGKPAFAAVATSGDYADLSNRPATNQLIPTGGATGQVLSKIDATNYNVQWATPAGGSTSNTYKEAVRVATTANGTLTTAYENGDIVDGVVLATGDRILIKNQTTASENGIYTVNASGTPTRAADFDTTGAEVANGAIIPVQLGTVNGGSTWQLVANGGTIGNSFRFAPLNNVLVVGSSSGTTPTATGNGAIVIGLGASTSSTADNVAIGNLASATGSAGAVALGKSASASSNSCIAIGNSASASILFGVAIGDTAVVSTSNRSGISLGKVATTTHAGAVSIGSYSQSNMPCELSFCSGYQSAYADAKASIVLARQVTTTATVTEIGLGDGDNGNPPNKIILANDSTYLFDCDIIARNTATDTESAAWNLKFAIRRGAAAANTALIGTPVKTIFGQDTGTTTWDVGVTADTTNGRPNISLTGEAAKTIRWVANIRLTKVSG